MKKLSRPWHWLKKENESWRQTIFPQNFLTRWMLTVVGMVINNNAYWSAYNYITLIISLLSGIVLLKQK